MPLHPGSIGETFAMLMAKCITSFSLGDGLEGHFQTIFQIFSTIFSDKLGRPLSISGFKPSQSPSLRVNVLTISRDEFPQASGA